MEATDINQAFTAFFESESEGTIESIELSWPQNVLQDHFWEGWQDGIMSHLHSHVREHYSFESCDFGKSFYSTYLTQSRSVGVYG